MWAVNSLRSRVFIDLYCWDRVSNGSRSIARTARSLCGSIPYVMLLDKKFVQTRPICSVPNSIQARPSRFCMCLPRIPNASCSSACLSSFPRRALRPTRLQLCARPSRACLPFLGGWRPLRQFGMAQVLESDVILIYIWFAATSQPLLSASKAAAPPPLHPCGRLTFSVMLGDQRRF